MAPTFRLLFDLKPIMFFGLYLFNDDGTKIRLFLVSASLSAIFFKFSTASREVIVKSTIALSFRTLLVCDVHLTLSKITVQIFLKKNMTVNSGNLLKKFLFLLAIYCIACGSDKEMKVNEMVAERLTAFREKKNAECQSELLAEAEQIVDSLLLAEAKMELSDSLIRLRPAKPPKPAPLPPIDSLPVQPIFEPASSTRGKK